MGTDCLYFNLIKVFNGVWTIVRLSHDWQVCDSISHTIDFQLVRPHIYTLIDQ